MSGSDGASDTDDAVLYEATASGVAILTFNRPDRLNAWGPDIAAGFYAAIDRAEQDPTIRAIVLTGRGRGFCAGAYLGPPRSAAEVGETMEKAGKTNLDELVGERPPHFVTTLRKPVIAAINGSCVGIGLTQALMCDVRFAAAGAKFAAVFARRGLIAEFGISWILPRLTNWGVALDLLLSGRTFLAEEAAELGLVKEVVAPENLMKRALDYAEDIAANCSPASMAVIKRQVYGDATRDVVEATSRAEVLLHEAMPRPDVIEGITSFLEKRPPQFPSLSCYRRLARREVPERTIMGNLSYKAIDVDNHYYEPLDAFTRHLDKKFKRRGVQMVSDGKRTWAVIGDRVNHFVPNPTFDPIIVPGCLDSLFRGEIPEGVDPASLMKVERLAEHPEYQNRDARIAVMDTQDIETVFMLPTFALRGRGSAQARHRGDDGVGARFQPLARRGLGLRPARPPDHRRADHLAGRSGRRRSKRWSSCWRGAPSWCWCGRRRCPAWSSRGRWAIRSHDPVWARLAEAGVPVGFHLSDSGYLQIAAMWGGKATFEGFGAKDPLDQVLVDDRAIHDTMASMIVHGVFTRHPKLKAVSIENGSYFVHRLVKRLKKVANNAAP